MHREPRIFQNIWNNAQEYSVAGRKMIYEKHLKLKISSHCLFNMLIIYAISHLFDQKHLNNFDHADQLHLKELFGDGRAGRRGERERWATKTETETGQE